MSNNYYVERRDKGGTWSRYTSNNSEAAADYSADSMKGSNPDSQVRVVDSKGNIRSTR